MSSQGAYFGVFAGPIDYYIGLLERFLGEQERAAQSLMAAAAFCERLGAPRWLARCLEALHVSD